MFSIKKGCVYLPQPSPVQKVDTFNQNAHKIGALEKGFFMLLDCRSRSAMGLQKAGDWARKWDTWF